jgi:Uma2 family endonuclease
MATAPALVGEERYLLNGVSWKAYEALLETWSDHRTRMTYDKGRLEFMSPLHSHEQYGHLLGRMIDAYTEELLIPIHGGQSTTFRDEEEQHGLEPDKCYWIQNESSMRGRKEFDISTDPPPDLAVEVDITSSSLDRMSIYAALGVPEVWRFDGETLTMQLLQTDETFTLSDRSLALPGLTAEDVMRFLRLSDEKDETSLIRSFRAWVRKQARPKRSTATRKRRPRGK